MIRSSGQRTETSRPRAHWDWFSVCRQDSDGLWLRATGVQSRDYSFQKALFQCNWFQKLRRTCNWTHCHLYLAPLWLNHIDILDKLFRKHRCHALDAQHITHTQHPRLFEERSRVCAVVWLVLFTVLCLPGLLSDTPVSVPLPCHPANGRLPDGAENQRGWQSEWLTSPKWLLWRHP